VSDERPSMRSAVAHGDSQEVLKARRVAEALFKAKVKPESIEAQRPTTDGQPLTDQPPRRTPRILTASQALPARLEPEIPVAPGPAAVQRQPATEIPASEYGRIRVLATYGMTAEQVARLYDVTLNEVRRILSM
jgi:hypothetical protein